MVHVEDVARAAQLVATAPAANGRVYVLTDNRPYATSEIYELMRDALGKRRRPWRTPRIVLVLAARCGDLIGRVRGRRFVIDSGSLRKLTESAWYSSRRIETELGFEPLLTLDAALPEIVRHYRDRGAEPRWCPSSRS
jgi:nucleoside-diphosphate-sugar epimerase